MEKHKKHVENIIKTEIDKEADAIRREINDAGVEDISKEQEEAILQKLEKRIEKQAKAQGREAQDSEFSEELAVDDIYAKLSKEDREALELGRKMKEKQKRTRKKRSMKLYVALAAALIMMLAIGMTSIGGAERISEVIKQVVGDREVTKVNSDESNMVLENEDEEKAYQEIKDTFGVEPVLITNAPEGMQFVQMNLDEDMQVAELLYQYNGKNMVYIISVNYRDSSFGIDMEDAVYKKEVIKNDGTSIDLTVYDLEEAGGTKCVAQFAHKGYEYVLVGMMKEDDFELILKNLYFY